jgi:hypothetical protein
MVQVDVFWSYGLGATFAVASSRQLLERRRRAVSRWTDPYLMRTLLFLALVFAPSGLYLVWAFPSWETMHVGDRDMPAWLIATFAVTNVTQGLLGFWVVERLLGAGRTYLAYLQIVLAYVGMFFILVHGWDGKGYERFFSATHADFVNWNGDWTPWLTSDVALTLLGMGVVLVPLLLWAAVAWQREGYALAPTGARRPGPATIAGLTLATVFAAALGLAVAASLLIHALGPAPGIPAALALGALALLPGGPVHRLFRAYGIGAEDVLMTAASAPRARAASGPTAPRRPVPRGSAGRPPGGAATPAGRAAGRR